MIRLDQYAKIKNNYCIVYLGASNEYLVQLKLLRPFFELRFKELNIFYCCRDECFKYLEEDKKSIKLTDLKNQKNNFAHIRELTYDGQSHPIMQLIDEANIKNYTIPVEPAKEFTNICLIKTFGSYPTVSLLKSQIKTIQRLASQQNLEVKIDEDHRNAGVVYGVESVELFESAAKGLKTYLIPTGKGEQLYKNMFKNGEVLNI